MIWSQTLKADPIPWLVEIDASQPGVRLFTLVELLDHENSDPEVRAAQELVMASGPVLAILETQSPSGYWVEPGPGYYPKYRGTVWQIIFLAQFGADGQDPRVRAGCEYVLDHSPSPFGGFSVDGRPGGMIHCLQGNLVAAMIDLGWWGDARLARAADWLARSITGAGIAPAGERKAEIRYYRSGNSAPGFACSANNHLPCAWGAVKAALALARIPSPDRSPEVLAALETAREFLLSRDPASADYPMGYSDKPSRSWFRFGYPIGYVTDVLQNLEALTALGCGGDPRLSAALALILDKQDAQGRWSLNYNYHGKTWSDIETKGKPSKWVTLRALRVIKRMAEASS